MKGCDIFSVPSPQQLVADCQAEGWLGVGGYAYDDDVSATFVWSKAHVDALKAAGIAFLPIITLRTGTTVNVATLVASLQALGWTGGPVGWDVEDTATPPYSTLQGLVGGVRAAGYGPMTGYFWPPTTWQPVYGNLFDYWWWGGGSTSQIPPGWAAIQYGFTIGPVSGVNYDTDEFSPVIFGTFAPPVVGGQEENVVTGEWAGQLHALWVDALGNLQHRWQGPGGPAWSGEVVGTGFSPSSQLKVVPSFAQQAHVFVNSAGKGTHLFQGPDGAWHSESL